MERRDGAVRPCYRPHCVDITRELSMWKVGNDMGVVNEFLLGFVVSAVFICRALPFDGKVH